MITIISSLLLNFKKKAIAKSQRIKSDGEKSFSLCTGSVNSTTSHPGVFLRAGRNPAPPQWVWLPADLKFNLTNDY